MSFNRTLRPVWSLAILALLVCVYGSIAIGAEITSSGSSSSSEESISSLVSSSRDTRGSDLLATPEPGIHISISMDVSGDADSEDFVVSGVDSAEESDSFYDDSSSSFDGSEDDAQNSYVIAFASHSSSSEDASSLSSNSSHNKNSTNTSASSADNSASSDSADASTSSQDDKFSMSLASPTASSLSSSSSSSSSKKNNSASADASAVSSSGSASVDGSNTNSSSSGKAAQSSASSVVPFFSAAQVVATAAVLDVLRTAFAGQLGDAWTGTENFCEWPQVFCSTSGVMVLLSNQNLVGTMPAVPASVVSGDVVMSALVLSNNKGITGSLDGSWNRLPNLIVLDVSGCSLSGALPE